MWWDLCQPAWPCHELSQAGPLTSLTLCPPNQGGTYGGSALGCAAAAATIDAIEEDGMLQARIH